MSENETVVKKERKSKKLEGAIPEEVAALAKELNLTTDEMLGWKVYKDRIVVIAMNGMKFTRDIA